MKVYCCNQPMLPRGGHPIYAPALGAPVTGYSSCEELRIPIVVDGKQGYEVIKVRTHTCHVCGKSVQLPLEEGQE